MHFNFLSPAHPSYHPFSKTLLTCPLEDILPFSSFHKTVDSNYLQNRNPLTSIIISPRPSTFHSSRHLHCLSRILVFTPHLQTSSLRTSCMLLAHLGILLPPPQAPLYSMFTFHVKLSFSASFSSYVWVLS